jgi:hypothetical protein
MPEERNIHTDRCGDLRSDQQLVYGVEFYADNPPNNFVHRHIRRYRYTSQEAA